MVSNFVVKNRLTLWLTIAIVSTYQTSTRGNTMELTIEQLKPLAKSEKWTRSESKEITDLFQGQIFGLAWVDHDCELGTVRYIEGFVVSEEGKVYRRLDDVTQNWQVEGFAVVDGDYTLSPREVGEILGKRFSTIDYDSFLCGLK